jgi:hypothetical protein
MWSAAWGTSESLEDLEESVANRRDNTSPSELKMWRMLEWGLPSGGVRSTKPELKLVGGVVVARFGENPLRSDSTM